MANLGQLTIDVWLRQAEFDCCDCGERLGDLSFTERIDLENGGGHAYRFLCAECAELAGIKARESRDG